jgi:hypothetical protein
MRLQFYHRPHIFFTEFGNLSYSQFPFTKITLFLHMSICAEPDQCSKKYFPDHFPRVQLRVYVLQSRLGPSSKWSICSSRLRTQLKICAVKVYVLGRLGPSCKSVYVLIDSLQDPAFQYEYMPWEPLSTQLFADKKYSIINIEQLSHTSITPQTLCSYACRYIKYLNIYI